MLDEPLNIFAFASLGRDTAARYNYAMNTSLFDQVRQLSVEGGDVGKSPTSFRGFSVVTTYLLRFPPAIYERLANPSERPMTAFSFECGVGSEKPSKALLGFHS